MFRRNALPKLSLAIVVAIVAYFFLFMTMARPAPLAYGDEIDWELAAIALALPIAFFSALVLGLWRALVAKDYMWLALQLAFFPLAYIYTLTINTGMGPNSSFKPNPLRHFVE